MGLMSGGRESGKVAVVDARGLWTPLLACLIFLLLGLWAFFAKSANVRGALGLLVLSCLLFAAAAGCFLIFRARRAGFIVDAAANVFSFPGGGMAATGFSCYFDPVFLLQIFRRFEIPLSQISFIDRRQRFKPRIIIAGVFGSLEYSFSSTDVRDRLYGILARTNRMGSPWHRS